MAQDYNQEALVNMIRAKASQRGWDDAVNFFVDNASAEGCGAFTLDDVHAAIAQILEENEKAEAEAKAETKAKEGGPEAAAQA